MIQLSLLEPKSFGVNKQIGLINGNDCRTLTDFYFHLGRIIPLPNYFGNNLDALEEVLQDYCEDHSQPPMTLLFTDYKMIGIEELEEKRLLLEGILNSLDNQRIEIIALG